MRAALLIAGKDLRQRLRDRSALLVAIVVPLVLASIFGLIFHDVDRRQACTFTFGVVDQDHGPAAQAFEQPGARARSQRSGLIKLRRESSLAAGRDAADSGKVAATFVLPAGLHGGVRRRPAGDAAGARQRRRADRRPGRRVDRAVLRQPRPRRSRSRPARCTARPTRRRPAAAARPDRARRRLDHEPAARRRHVLRRRDGRLLPVLHGPVRDLEHPRRAPRRHARADARGADPPRRRCSAGKLLTSLVLGVVSMAVLALATHFLLDAHWGNPLGVAILIVAGVLAATAVMALVATFARTPDQARRLAVDGRARARDARRDVLPRLPGRRAAGKAEPGHAAGLVPARDREPRGRRRRASAVFGPAAAILAVRRRHRQRWRSCARGGWSRDEGARDRRDRSAAAAALADEHLLPLRPADADHPAARRPPSAAPTSARDRRRSADRAGRWRASSSPSSIAPGDERLRRYTSAPTLQRAVARGNIDAGLVAAGRTTSRPARGRERRGSSFFARPDSVAPAAARDDPVGRRPAARVLAVAQLLVRRRHSPVPASARASHAPRQRAHRRSASS